MQGTGTTDLERRLFSNLEIEEIDGDRVSGGNLGMHISAPGSKARIEIPTFSKAWRRIFSTYRDKGIRQAYRDAIDGLREYILGHEMEVEHNGRPCNFEQEAALEADYLGRTWERNPVGIITHYIRDKGGDNSGLYRALKRRFSIKEAYRGLKEAYGEDYISGLTDRVSEILGLKPLKPPRPAYGLEVE